MRDHTTPLFRQLAAAGVRAPTLTPGSDVQATIFNITGLEASTGDMRNYVQNFVIRCTTVLDQPGAGGAVIDWDKMYKAANGIRLFSPLLGEPYPLAHTRGATLGHIFQVVAGGYNYPQPARIQVAAADGDTTVDLYYILPFSFECFAKPHETAQFAGFFDQGELEFRFAAATAFDGDSTGALTKATTTIRAWVEYYPSPDNVIGVPFQFREYIVPGNSTEFVLRGVGQSSGLRGTAPGAGLIMLAWLTNATGIGLAGADTAAVPTRIDIPWRSQVSMDTLDPYFTSLRRMVGKRVGPAATVTTAALADSSGWPNTMAATLNNSPAAAGAMFVPIIMPGREFETSKAQKVQGDLTVNMGFSTTPTGSSRFVTCELLEYTVEHLAVLARAMGIDPDSVEPAKKALRKNDPDNRKLAYTRTVLVPTEAE